MHAFLSYCANKIKLCVRYHHKRKISINSWRTVQISNNTKEKKTAIMLYRTVCTPEENYVSDNTRQEGHWSLPFFTKLVMLVYGVTRAQVLTPWSTSCGGTWRTWCTGRNCRHENCCSKSWNPVTTQGEMIELSERQQIIFWVT